MERVKGNADRQKNIEVRWLVDDADLRHQPLEVLEQKIPVFEKTEHAQVHTNACDEPAVLGMSIFRFADLTPEPKVHRGRGKEKSGERRIPRSVKNVTGDDEKIFPRLPPADAPIQHQHDREKDDEGERIEEHRKLICLS